MVEEILFPFVLVDLESLSSFVMLHMTLDFPAFIVFIAREVLLPKRHEKITMMPWP